MLIERVTSIVANDSIVCLVLISCYSYLIYIEMIIRVYSANNIEEINGCADVEYSLLSRLTKQLKYLHYLQ